MSFDAVEKSVFGGNPVECYRFTMGATEWRFTSADVEITLPTGVYTMESIEREELDFSQEETAANLTVRVPRTNAVAQLFVAYTPVAPVTLVVYRKHRSDAEIITSFPFTVISASFEGPWAVFTCAPFSQTLRARCPSVLHGSRCVWGLYREGCGVNKAAFKDSGVVLTVVADVVTATIFGTRVNGWYKNGWAQNAAGERRFIVEHVGTAITLESAFQNLIIGAAIDAYAGCDRTEATCTSKFANLVNFLGFPRVPQRNPYTQAIV